MKRGALVVLVALAACNRSVPQTGAPGAPPASAVAASASRSPAETRALVLARDPDVDDLWARAKDGDDDDLARLAVREGSAGLMERGADQAYRATAVRALAHVAPDSGGLSALAWLVEVALGAEESESAAALASIADLSAEPRRAVDPEDALELRAGCERLLGFAKDVSRPKKHRIEAIHALRMLADRGCVKSAEIPVDLDAR